MAFNQKSAYAEKLRDPRWQKKRLEILNRDNFTCRKCSDDKSPLHVHHTYYNRRPTEPWDYPENSLVTLCEGCHEVETEQLKDAEFELLKAIKGRGFFSESIMHIAYAFDCLNLHETSQEIDAEIVYQVLSNRRFTQQAYKAYFKKISGGSNGKKAL